MKKSFSKLLTNFKKWYKDIKLLLWGMISLLLILICIYTFYHYCNKIVVRHYKFSLSTDPALRSVDSCKVNIAFNWSDIKNCKRPGHSIEYTMHKDSTTKFKSFKNNNLSIDSVWGKVDIEIANTTPNYFFVSLPQHPIIRNMSKSILIIKAKRKKREADNMTYYISQGTFYHKGEENTQTGFAATSNNIDRENPHFFSWRNVGVICLIVDIKNIATNALKLEIDYNSPMNFMNIYPEPDEKTVSGILYESPEKISYIKKKGLYIYAEAITMKSLQDSRNFILSTGIGAIATLIFSILYKIVRKKGRSNSDIIH